MRLPGLPRLPVSRRRHGYAPSGDTSREDIPPPPDTARALAESGRLLAEAREAFYAVRRERDKTWMLAAEVQRERDQLQARVAELLEDRRKASERRDELMAERDDARLRGIRVERERDECRRCLAKANRQRDAAQARVVELEQAIRSHRDHQFPEGSHDAVQRFEQAMAVNRRLWAVLDGHDRQERYAPPNCRICNDTGTFELGGHEYWCKSCRGIPDPPPAEPDRDLIGRMEQPNPKPRRRRLGPDWQHLQGGWP